MTIMSCSLLSSFHSIGLHGNSRLSNTLGWHSPTEIYCFTGRRWDPTGVLTLLVVAKFGTVVTIAIQFKELDPESRQRDRRFSLGNTKLAKNLLRKIYPSPRKAPHPDIPHTPAARAPRCVKLVKGDLIFLFFFYFFETFRGLRGE